MFLKFDVVNGSKTSLGKTGVMLDFKANQWVVNDDKAGAWKKLATSRSGKFEVKDWGVMWMWDKDRNFAIVHKPPASGNDASNLRGTARLYDPVDSSLKDAWIDWNVEMTNAAKVSIVLNKPMPLNRMAMIERLNMLFPAPYLSLNNDLLTSKLRKDDPKVLASPGKYTSCGSLPGFVSGQVALGKGMKGDKFTKWMKTNSLNGTNRVRDIGIAMNCWEESSPTKKPKPGDIYVLLDRGLTNKKTGGVAHVGVFDVEIGKSWRTFDLGQGGGFDGAKNTREYKPATCELYGESNQGGGFRTVAGWVDLDKYMAI